MEVQKSQNQELTSFLQTRVRELEFIPKPLIETLNKVCFTIGIPASLGEIELNLIFNHLKKEHGLVRMEEIEDAFSKYSAEKLKFNHLGKEVMFIEHFGKFDNTFISRILNAYEKYKQENIKPPKRTELDYTPTKEDDETHFKFIAKVFKETKQAPLIANWNAAYLHAEKIGLINLTNDEKGMFMENVIEELKEEKQRLKVQRLNWSSIEETLTTPALLKYECRKRILTKYFENEQ